MNQELMEMEKKPNMLAFQVALIFAFYSIVIIAIQNAMGVSSDASEPFTMEKLIWSLLAYIPFILAIVYVQKKHRSDLGGYITFGRAFSAGFRTGFYASLVLAILMFVYFGFFDPAAMQKIQDNAMANADGEETAAQIEKMSSYTIYFMAFAAAIWYTVLGIIVALIGAAIMKKERPLYVEEETVVAETNL